MRGRDDRYLLKISEDVTGVKVFPNLLVEWLLRNGWRCRAAYRVSHEDVKPRQENETST